MTWFADYLRDEGFEIENRPLSDLRTFSELPHQKINHIMAIDGEGVIDPQDDPAEYRSVDDFGGIAMDRSSAGFRRTAGHPARHPGLLSTVLRTPLRVRKPSL